MRPEKKPLKLLHTSDWHLGRRLYGRTQYDIFERFLDWLLDTIRRESIDILLVAGDIFDTGTPSNRAQSLYYRFLCRAADSGCSHLVVIAGNHDSPTFLDAPKALLETLHVHVVGSATQSPEEEALVLRDPQGAPALVVCAVPYLRDRDVRTAEAGESLEDKDRKLADGIRAHYEAVAAAAETKRMLPDGKLPVVAMGHLFAAGGKTAEGDGVRDLYVGSLARVTGDIFVPFDYTALGHLHIPQRVGGADNIRYSGSPVPMGFGEADQKKSVCVVSLDRSSATVTAVDVPVFQPLARIAGDWDRIAQRLSSLKADASSAWLEIVYDGDAVLGDLRERVECAVSGSALEILSVKNFRRLPSAMNPAEAGESLADLDIHDVFERCLESSGVPDAERPGLVRTYREAVASLFEDDPAAE